MKRDRTPNGQEIKAALENDPLGRNIYLNNLAEMLTTISESTVLAIDGKWGSGKTFFINQFEYLTKNPGNYANITKDIFTSLSKQYSIFYFNAWENDVLPPTESILLRLSDSLWDKTDKIKNEIVGIIEKIANISFKYVSNGAIDIKNLKKTYISDYIQRARYLIKAHEEISNLLCNYRENAGKKVLFIIDDLDRCKPSFAVELLEAVKHVFSDDNAVFLICANNGQLQHTIKKYYGEGFDGYDYLDRFYDLIINLPEPNIEKYAKHVLKLKNSDYYCNLVAIDVMEIGQMSLRQANRYISNLSLIDDFIQSQGTNFSNQCDNCIKTVFVQIAAALRLLDKKQYDDFATGNGEEILKEFYRKSSSIQEFNSSNSNNGLSIFGYYKSMFDPRGEYYNKRELFNRAISSIGFSTIVDVPHDELRN